MAAEPDVFCLKWNNHNSNLRAVLCNLLADSEFCDVTLGAEGKLLHAHRLVLIACSDYFKALLRSVLPGQHPLILLPGISYAELRALLDYMYYGEVSINKADLASLIRSSRALEVKSLGEVSEQLRGEASDQLRQPTASEPTLPEVSTGPLVDKEEEEILYLDQHNQIIEAVQEEESMPRLPPVLSELEAGSRQVGSGGGPQYRKKQSKVWEFFEKSAAGDRVVCRCGEVQRFMSNTTNMIRHIKKVHSGGGNDVTVTRNSMALDTPSTSIQLRRRAVTRSEVWSHFSKVGETRVQCSVCKELYSYSGNTTNLRFHLKTRHPEVVLSKVEEVEVLTEEVVQVAEEEVVSVGQVVEEVVGGLGESISVEVCGLAEEAGLGSSVYVAATPASYIA